MRSLCLLLYLAITITSVALGDIPSEMSQDEANLIEKEYLVNLARLNGVSDAKEKLKNIDELMIQFEPNYVKVLLKLRVLIKEKNNCDSSNFQTIANQIETISRSSLKFAALINLGELYIRCNQRSQFECTILPRLKDMIPNLKVSSGLIISSLITFTDQLIQLKDYIAAQDVISRLEASEGVDPDLPDIVGHLNRALNKAKSLH